MNREVISRISSGNRTTYTNPNLYIQELMNDFYGSLEKATASGITYEKKSHMEIGNLFFQCLNKKDYYL